MVSNDFTILRSIRLNKPIQITQQFENLTLKTQLPTHVLASFG